MKYMLVFGLSAYFLTFHADEYDNILLWLYNNKSFLGGFARFALIYFVLDALLHVDVKPSEGQSVKGETSA